MDLHKGQGLAHYELLEELGQGGMGVVWRARDTRLDRQVAIKFLPEHLEADTQRLARFEREARAVAALNHPNIVTIHSVEEADGKRFLTMELVLGKPLAALIPAGGLPLARLLEIAIPLAGATGVAHERGIIHRDLKPGNIMVNDQGQVKILDFGLAMFREPEPASEELDLTTISASSAQIVSGTAAYMSPEQVRGGRIDHRSDIFSLGVILYEMATGQRPFQGKTLADLCASILKEAPVPPVDLQPRLPAEFGRVVMHCLDKDPKQRLQAAVDLRQQLDDLRRSLAGGEVHALPSIAVLPFADMSREKDQGYFCEGMAEEIINTLSGVKTLHVASRTSAFQFKGQGADSREIGQRLRVATLLEGSVRKSGGRLRIAVQLVDAAAGYELWSERYDREMDDVFAIQEEIAQNVVRALAVTLAPGEIRLIPKPPTTDVQAYDYYLRARNFYFHYGRRDMEFALQLFARAIELDPDYARAYAGMADCWSYLFMYADGGENCRRQAEAASARALALDPRLAEAHASLGLALSLSQRDPAARQAFERAIELDPRLFEARYFYARHCFTRGDLEQAIRLYEEASRVRPEDYQSPLLVGQIYDDLGRREEGRRARRRGVEIAERNLQLNPDDVRALYMGANGLVALGERERGLQWAARALELAPQDAMLLYNVACIQSLAGEIEPAIGCLEKAVAAGLTQTSWIDHDSNLDALRSHPRFLALMRRLEPTRPSA